MNLFLFIVLIASSSFAADKYKIHDENGLTLFSNSQVSIDRDKWNISSEDKQTVYTLTTKAQVELDAYNQVITMKSEGSDKQDLVFNTVMDKNKQSLEIKNLKTGTMTACAVYSGGIKTLQNYNPYGQLGTTGVVGWGPFGSGMYPTQQGVPVNNGKIAYNCVSASNDFCSKVGKALSKVKLDELKKCSTTLNDAFGLLSSEEYRALQGQTSVAVAALSHVEKSEFMTTQYGYYLNPNTDTGSTKDKNKLSLDSFTALTALCNQDESKRLFLAKESLDLKNKTQQVSAEPVKVNPE